MNATIPFFSIVIATYNYGRFLEYAIVSVLKQSCQDFELIIVDGGSKDNTIDIIKKYESHIAWWISEPDKGQSDAFNKGFRHSRGKFLTWLNADDVYFPDALAAVKEKLLSHPEAKWATGNFMRFRDSDKRIIEAQWGPHFLPCILQTANSPVVIFGPTAFWSREVYEYIGDLDETLHYTMDTDYWCRIKQHGFMQVRVNHDIWAFRMHEESKTAEFDDHLVDNKVSDIIKKEHHRIYEKTAHSPSKYKVLLLRFIRIVDGSFLKGIYRSCFIKGNRPDFLINENSFLAKLY